MTGTSDIFGDEIRKTSTRNRGPNNKNLSLFDIILKIVVIYKAP